MNLQLNVYTSAISSSMFFFKTEEECMFIGCMYIGEQWWRSRWEHSPPTNVARVQIRASTPYVGWVCCWFSPLLREVFLRVLWFSPLLKNQTFPNFNSTRNQVDEELLCGCATCKSLFIYLFIYFIFILESKPCNFSSWSDHKKCRGHKFIKHN